MSILVVDDASLIRARFISMLRLRGCDLSIYEATNAREALAHFERFRPTIVVLDINLPDDSGIELLRHLKAERPQTYVLMFTNQPSSQHRERCLRAGADYFFDKSDDFESAVTTIHSLSRAV